MYSTIDYDGSEYKYKDMIHMCK